MEIQTDYSVKQLLLAFFLGVSAEDVVVVRDNEFEAEVDGETQEYSVFTDDEADAAAKDYMEGFVDEFVLSQIPDNLHSYFDSDRFISESLNVDGRAHHLNRYDGSEEELDPTSHDFQVWVLEQIGSPAGVEFHEIIFGGDWCDLDEMLFAYRTN